MEACKLKKKKLLSKIWHASSSENSKTMKWQFDSNPLPHQSKTYNMELRSRQSFWKQDTPKATGSSVLNSLDRNKQGY